MDAATLNKEKTRLMDAVIANNMDRVKHEVDNYPEQIPKKDDHGWDALLHCCNSGSMVIFQYLVQTGMDPTTTSTTGESCLMIAALNSEEDIVKYIAAKYPYQDLIKTDEGYNALLYCCAGGSVEIFKYLAQTGMDTATTSNIGTTCLMVAALHNSIDLVKYLAENYPEQLPLKDKDGFNALLCCCAGGSVEIFQYLVQTGMDTTLTSNDGKTCLMVAAQWNKLDLVKYIAENYKAQLSLKDTDGMDALLCCCAGGSVEIFQYLVQKDTNATMKSDYKYECLKEAVLASNVDLVKYLIKGYKEHVLFSKIRGTALLICCFVGSVEIFQYLVQTGIDVTTTSMYGQTSLMIAAVSNNIDLVKYLVENYPDLLLMKDPYGIDALLYSCFSGSIKIFQYLVQKGMDPTVQTDIEKIIEYLLHLIRADEHPENDLWNTLVDGLVNTFQHKKRNELDTPTTANSGQTCLMLAVQKNNIELVKYLVDTYPDMVSIKDINGMDALLYCCRTGSVEMFQYLVQKGMDPESTSVFGQSCLMHALKADRTEIFQYLCEKYENQLITSGAQNELMACCRHGSVKSFLILEKVLCIFKRDINLYSKYIKTILSTNDALSEYIVKKYKSKLKTLLWNPLLPVCSRGNLKIFKWLIELGFDPNTCDSGTGKTCLMYASAEGHEDIVQYILKLPSVNIHAIDHNGCTALHHCKGMDKCWDYLIKEGLRPDLKSKNGKTAFQYTYSRRSGIYLSRLTETFEDICDAYIKDFISLFDGEKEDYRHIRVFFLGPKGAGKTTTCQRLQGEPDTNKNDNIYKQLFKVDESNTWTKLKETPLDTITGERLSVVLKQKRQKKTVIKEEVDAVWVPNRKKSEKGRPHWSCNRQQQQGKITNYNETITCLFYTTSSFFI